MICPKNCKTSVAFSPVVRVGMVLNGKISTVREACYGINLIIKTDGVDGDISLRILYGVVLVHLIHPSSL